MVHDLTNRKSHENLQRWLYEIINKDAKDTNRTSCDSDFDPEFFLGSTQVSSSNDKAKCDSRSGSRYNFVKCFFSPFNI